MKIKLLTLMNSKVILEKLSSKEIIDGVTGYRLYRNIKNINPEMENFEKVRGELVKKYGTPKEDGGIEVLADKKDVYFKELNVVLAEEVEISILPINPENLSGLSPFEFLLMEWMFENKEV